MGIIIKNIRIADGSSAPAFYGNIYVEEDKITKVEAIDKQCNKQDTGVLMAEEDQKDTVIDGTGLTAAPGFIDTHSHSDLKILTEPEVLPKVMQGITTEVLGQDGISMAPLPAAHLSSWKKNLAGLDGESEAISWAFDTTDKYLKAVEEAVPGVNEAYLVPHGNIRMEVMGLEDRRPTSEEIDRMCEVTRREMQAGCYGLSSGLIYIPCAYGGTKELIAMCRIVAQYDGVFVVHQRSEADDILTSMQEVIEIGRQSGVRIHFSHFKVCGKENWDKIDEVLKFLDQAKEEGITISFDQYPYVAGSTMLGIILPPWAHDGGTDQLMERLQDTELREKMKQDIKNGIPGWDNFVAFAGVEGIYVTSTKTAGNEQYIGLSLKEIGEKTGKDPLDAAFDLLYEEENAVGMIDFYGKEEHIIRFMQREEMNACTDGLLAGKPHPRVYGAFPRILGKYVREEKVLSLEEAVYKMTYKAAKAMKLPLRGLIREGYYADVTIFDDTKVIDQSTFLEPIQFPLGIEYVIVNGVLTVEKGKHLNKRAGRVLRA